VAAAGEASMKNKITVTVATITSLVAGSALAADMPARMPTKAVPYVAAFNWTGGYVGLNAGYGWTSNRTGAIGGAQIGYNWQVGTFVYGLEADIQASGESGTKNVTDATGAITLSENRKMNYFGTARGRLGIAQDRVLYYVTGGLAYTTIKRSVTGLVGAAGTDSASNSKAGYAFGGGIEWAFAQNWSAKVEYLYMGYSGTTNTYGALVPVTTVNNGRLTDNVVRVGVNYHF
jgi:outer membrane immunogenic protein